MRTGDTEKDQSDVKIVDIMPDNIADYGVCGYSDVEKHVTLRRKIQCARYAWAFIQNHVESAGGGI